MARVGPQRYRGGGEILIATLRAMTRCSLVDGYESRAAYCLRTQDR